MKQMTRNPYLVFTLGAAVGMVILVGCSFLLSNRLDANNAFAVFFLLLPVLAAVYCFSGLARASGGRWIVKWLGTTVFSLVACVVVLFASLALVPFKARAAYNYPHFNPGTYPHTGGQLAKAGGRAPDGTLYTLEGKEVRLSDLWKERPIVVEFGSIT